MYPWKPGIDKESMGFIWKVSLQNIYLADKGIKRQRAGAA